MPALGRPLRACLELSAAMVLVGSSVVVGTLVVAKVRIFLIGGLRFALASLILVPVLLARERRMPALSRRDAGVLLLQAFAGIFAFNVLLLYGLTLTSAAESGIVTATTPAVTAVLAILLLREPWSARRAAGMGLAVLWLLALNLEAAGAPARHGPCSATSWCWALSWARGSSSLARARSAAS